MSKGNAPIASSTQHYGKIKSYVLHHINPIHNGGKVYDLDNIQILTPLAHQSVLDKKFHFNN